MKYRTRPCQIEAIQYLGTFESNREIIDWCRGSDTPAFMDKRVTKMDDGCVIEDTVASLHISTLEGTHVVTSGDFVIKGLAGEFYPCKPEIFAKKYEMIE